MACNFNCLIENEGLFKVTGSHVHCKSGIVSEMVQDGTLLFQITESDMAYRLVAIPTTLSDL